VVVRVPARDDDKMAAAAEPGVIEGQEALFSAGEGEGEGDAVIDLTDAATGSSPEAAPAIPPAAATEASEPAVTEPGTATAADESATTAS
jgi:hypothetical protein